MRVFSALGPLYRPRCPACNTGALFDTFLTIHTHCPECRLPLMQQEKGDGPAFLVIVVLGFLVTGLAAWLELAYAPPVWIHLAVWPAVTIGGSVYGLRLAKAWMLHMQYRHRPQDFTATTAESADPAAIAEDAHTPSNASHKAEL